MRARKETSKLKIARSPRNIRRKPNFVSLQGRSPSKKRAPKYLSIGTRWTKEPNLAVTRPHTIPALSYMTPIRSQIPQARTKPSAQRAPSPHAHREGGKGEAAPGSHTETPARGCGWGAHEKRDFRLVLTLGASPAVPSCGPDRRRSKAPTPGARRRPRNLREILREILRGILREILRGLLRELGAAAAAASRPLPEPTAPGSPATATRSTSAVPRATFAGPWCGCPGWK